MRSSHDCLENARSRLRWKRKWMAARFHGRSIPCWPASVVHCYVEDITDRLSLEEQLRQSQKMESVGQLAAGVAHDFNNMLTIIQGHSSALLASRVAAGNLEPVQAVYFAAERAAGLTRQLLMFSRKNIMQPRPLDLRETVGNMSKMLQRLLGETITLEFHCRRRIAVRAGRPGMIEQV
jgi:two-component system, cell cycle sensor histidine kinase and response regulator CckA